MQLEWHWEGDSGHRFYAVLTGLDDTTPLMRDITQYLFHEARQRFAREESPDGAKWAPRSPATLASYRREKSVWGRILQKEGGLFDTLATEAGNGYASIFVNQPYAAVMQFGASKGAFGNTRRGSPIPWGNIPARPYLGIAEPQETNIYSIIEEWLESVGGTDS